jgi:glycosyltransferase involved in cell wall biosynthesis
MFSIIIPCFNSEKFVRRAVESAMRQARSGYEIILVDNNSSDNTVSILEEYSKNYPSIIKVLHEHKKGAPAARNKGLLEAKGEWIQFLDSDDELLPDKIEYQIKLAEKSNADIVVGDSYVYKVVKGEIVKSIRSAESSNVWKGLLTSKLGITSANLWKKKNLLEVGGWNESKSSSQEYDLLFRLLKKNASVSFCPTPLTIIHMNVNSISNSKNDKRIIEILDNNLHLRTEIKEYLKSEGKLTKELNQAADMFIYITMLRYSTMAKVFFQKGIIPEYIRKTTKETSLDLPVIFLIKVFTRHAITEISKLFKSNK